MRVGEVLLLQGNVAQAPPGVVVGYVSFQSGLVALLAVVVVLIGDELVAAQGVSVGETLVDLNRSCEKLECSFVLFEQAVAIPDDTPRFRREERYLDCLVAQIDEGGLVLEVPEASGEVFEPFKTVGLKLSHFFVDPDRLVVPRLLVDALGELPLHPSCLLLLAGELGPVDLFCLLAMVPRLLRISFSDNRK